MQATEQSERTQWLVQRQQGIGGSDAAALFGVHPFQSPFALYQSKVAKVIDDSDSPAQYWGRQLEAAVRDAYQDLVGRKVGPGVTMQKHADSQLAFMVANTDGTVLAVPNYDGDGVYEGKTTNVFNAKQWDDGVPLYYQVQVQHYMAVTGLQWSSVAVLILGARDPFHWADIPRNDDFIAALQEREHAFWRDHVLARVPPDTDGSKSTAKALTKLFPKDNGRVIVLPPAATGWDMRRREIGAQIRELKEEQHELDNALKAAIGDASYGAIVDDEGEVQAGYSCRLQYVKEQVRAAYEFRSLRVASPKTVAGIMHDQMKVADEEDL